MSDYERISPPSLAAVLREAVEKDDRGEFADADEMSAWIIDQRRRQVEGERDSS